MPSPKMEVKCSVENCYYYSEGRCHASALEVNPMSNCAVETSSETSCTTFKPDEDNYT